MRSSLIICMVRPRAPAFSMINRIRNDVRGGGVAFKAGCSRDCFWFLHADFTIDVEASGRMINLIHTYGKDGGFSSRVWLPNDMEEGIKQSLSLWRGSCFFDKCLCATAEHGIDHLLSVGTIWSADWNSGWRRGSHATRRLFCKRWRMSAAFQL